MGRGLKHKLMALFRGSLGVLTCGCSWRCGAGSCWCLHPTAAFIPRWRRSTKESPRHHGPPAARPGSAAARR